MSERYGLLYTIRYGDDKKPKAPIAAPTTMPSGACVVTSRPSPGQLIHAAKLAPAPAPAPTNVQSKPRWTLFAESNTRNSRMSARGIERSPDASRTTTVSELADTRVARNRPPRLRSIT